MRAVDLFCGVGGFHLALQRIGGNHEVVFACDIDEACREVYSSNFGIVPSGDIRLVLDEVPDHDLLMAGFPCQPFSKSGSQMGFEDETRGTLFHEISRVIEEHGPSLVLLENVRNLESHDEGRTLGVISGRLNELGYDVKQQILSPHEFGIPHHRPRIFIVAFHREKVPTHSRFVFPDPDSQQGMSVKSIRDQGSDGEESLAVSNSMKSIIDHWTEFMRSLPSQVRPPNPTWSMEFGRTYQLDLIHPISEISRDELVRILSDEGISIEEDTSIEDILDMFPPYIRSMKSEMPEWKRRFIENNRRFWDSNRGSIGEEWLEEVRKFNDSFQKFEWHVGMDADRDLMSHMIHLRPSGIRVSRLDWIPALVAMAQIPIIGPWNRRLSVREAANSQSFPKEFVMHRSASEVYKQFGNSVNVEVVARIMENMFETLELSLLASN